MSDDYDFSEPWPIYANEEKPWTDYERLLKLRERMDTQDEMGDALGCTPSTVSHHLQKAREQKEKEERKTSNPCETCDENEVPGKGEQCGECLDEARHADSEYDDFGEVTDKERA